MYKKQVQIKESNYQLEKMVYPMVFEHFFRMMFGVMDTYVLSGYKDVAAAAVGYANQLLDIIYILFQVAVTGTTILLAQAIGARREKEAKEICCAAIWLGICGSGVLVICLAVFRSTLLKYWNLDATLLDYAGDYLDIMNTNMIFVAIFTIVAAIFRSYGKTLAISVIGVVGNVINLLGDLLVRYGVIQVMGMVKDVAMVTVIANVITVLLAGVVSLGGRKLQVFHIPRKKIVVEILRLGIPSAGESFAYKTSQLVITSMIAVLGVQALAAKTYGLTISKILVIIPKSIATSAGVLVGVQMGKGNIGKVKEVVSRCLKKGGWVVIWSNIIVLVFGKTIIRQFTQDEEIVKLAYVFLCMEGITMLLKKENLILGNALRAVKDIYFPVRIGIMSMWIVGVGCAYLFGIYWNMGLAGMCFAFFIDEGIRAICMKQRWRKKMDVGNNISGEEVGMNGKK